MERWYEGQVRLIVFCNGAEASRLDAEAGVPGHRSACKTRLVANLKLVGNFQRVQDEIFRHEEDGVFAVRTACGLRGYGWLDRYEAKPAFIVSHFILKKTQKLDRADLEKVQAARRQYQGGQ